jgi:hypothetical protein
MVDLPDIEDWAVRSHEPVAADTAAGAVLLSLKAQKYFSLNPTAAAIWARLETPSQLCTIRDALVLEFHAPHDEVEGALLDFVASLVAQDIVTVRKHPFPAD